MFTNSDFFFEVVFDKLSHEPFLVIFGQTASTHQAAKGQSPVAAIAAAVVAAGTSAVRNRVMPKQTSVMTECWHGERSCILKIGTLLTLSTFDAQGIADMLNSREESTERMANTKVRWREGVVFCLCFAGLFWFCF